jgi:hypothetical protein
VTVLIIIGSVLLGAILGRFFKVLVLLPAFALSLAIVLASSAYFGHSLSRTFIELVALVVSLQLGYVSGLLLDLPRRGAFAFTSDSDYARSDALENHVQVLICADASSETDPPAIPSIQGDPNPESRFAPGLPFQFAGEQSLVRNLVRSWQWLGWVNLDPDDSGDVKTAARI